MVKVRFAPSPTGFLHIGGARTALFNLMYAKAQKGIFVLRVEDTDLQRSKKEYVDEILDSMKWLGLDWDELYYQSERFEIYREYAQKLLEEGKAYKDGEAIILKMLPQQVKIFDLIRGEIQFDTETIKDQVLMKSDGSPTYSFACVVDDAAMEISCVIRGEDHISNTPKQIMIYQALGLKPPKYAHLPLIMGEDGTRLSKRNGAVAVSDYRQQGFLPEALINYLMLLGWSPGNNKEIVSFSTAVKNFSIKKVNKAAAIFSMNKLKWINGQYIKQADEETLIDLLIPFLRAKGYIKENFDRNYLKNVVHLFKGRLSTLLDFLEWTDYIFKDQIDIDAELKEKYLSEDRKGSLKELGQKFKKVDVFNAVNIETAFKEVVAFLNLQSSDLVHPLRVAVTGRAVGPGLFEAIEVLGKQKTLERLEKNF